MKWLVHGLVEKRYLETTQASPSSSSESRFGACMCAASPPHFI